MSLASNLWGVTFAALPLRERGTYTLPLWQYDKGFGTFTVRVLGSKIVDPRQERPSRKLWTRAMILRSSCDTALRRQRARNSAMPPGTTLNGLAARACQAGLETAIETAESVSQGMQFRESLGL